MRNLPLKIRNIPCIAMFSLIVCAPACSRSPAPADTAGTAPAANTRHAEAKESVATQPGAAAAMVNGKSITVSEIRAIFDRHIEPYRRQIPPEQIEALWQAEMPEILKMVVGQRLIRDEIANHDIKVSAEDIDVRLEEFRQQAPPEHTLEELTGMSSAEIRHAIGEGLAFEKLLDIFDLGVKDPAETDLQEYYDRHTEDFQVPETARARHILISVDDAKDEADRDARRVKAEAIRQQLLDGADFAELAAQHSDCPSGQRGGDLGAFGREQMVPPFEAAAFGQEPGVIGTVFETDFGYHIVQVVERESARQLPLKEVSEHIGARLLETARQEQHDALLEKLRAKADIEYLLP